jgi:hypothetical protein
LVACTISGTVAYSHVVMPATLVTPHDKAFDTFGRMLRRRPLASPARASIATG